MARHGVTTPASVSTSREPAKIAGMFDGIARRYDTLNHVLSGGLDLIWRRRAIRALAMPIGARLLDMCTGTGDLALAALRGTAPAADVVGIDFSGEMLRHGLAKVRAAGLESRIRLVRGDATRVPLPDASVDAAAVAFGIRNVVDRDRACREFCRVLKPGGRLAVLEFGNPTMPGWKQVYGWYSTVVLPRVGAMISGNSVAYSYLPASISQFPEPPQFAEGLRAAGFSKVEWKAQTFGTVYLFIATK
jgi:demethylmenaquinone methyltransferase/2-methoxy-6-polyprenyl-1,4-benzoquinol methylase